MSEIKPTTELAEFVNKTELEDATKLALIEAFEPFHLEAMEWKEKADAIKVNSIEDVKAMKDAREGRLLLQKKRTSLDKMRKTLKEDSLRKGQTIDAIAKQLTAIIEPIEESLREKEEFKDRFMSQMREELKSKRMDELKAFDVDGSLYSLDTLPEERYQDLLTNSRLAKETKDRLAAEEVERQRVEAERLEQERIERERAEAEAREAQRVENEILQKENEEIQRMLAEQKQKAEAEQKAKEAQLTKEREEAAAAIAEERRIAAEKQAEQEKIIAQERAKAEKEKKIAEQRAADERAKVEAEREAAEKKLRDERRTAELKAEAIRQEQEKKLAEEREATAKLQREIQAKKDEEERLRQEEETRKEAELAKGDSDKMKDLIADLKALQTKYIFKSTKFKTLYLIAIAAIDNILDRLNNK